MKKLVLVGCLLALAGCESRTDYGECVGLGEKQNQSLEYKLSPRNLVIGVVFVEMVIPPIIVVTDELYCPVGKTKEVK